MFAKISLILFLGFLAWAFQAIQPPPPTICGSPNGPPITATRIKLSDGRYLAYRETGVPKQEAKFKIISAHGLDSSRNLLIPASQELVEELGLYFLSFDRAGYGESDPNPKRSVRSEAFDIQELADRLEIGLKFYVVGGSMGGYSVWSCLRYIPYRLAGAALIVPTINYWWPGFPSNLSREAYNQILPQDQWAFGVAHYSPWLTYWWNTQKWFPSSSVIHGNPRNMSPQDKEILSKFGWRIIKKDESRQQGVFESLHRDLIIGFGTWEFDPMDLGNPFPNNEGSVHLWQGYADRLCPVILQRYVSKRLPWIRYHEVPNGGHAFFFVPGFADTVLKGLLLGDQPSDITC